MEKYQALPYSIQFPEVQVQGLLLLEEAREQCSLEGFQIRVINHVIL